MLLISRSDWSHSYLFCRLLDHLLHRDLQVTKSPILSFCLWNQLCFQLWSGDLHTMGREHPPANRSRLQHFFHGLLFHSGEFLGTTSKPKFTYSCLLSSSSRLQTSFGLCSNLSLLSTSSPSPSQLSPYTWIEHGLVVSLNLQRKFILFRVGLFAGSSFDGCSWHPTVPQHPKNLNVHEVPKIA